MHWILSWIYQKKSSDENDFIFKELLPLRNSLIICFIFTHNLFTTLWNFRGLAFRPLHVWIWYHVHTYVPVPSSHPEASPSTSSYICLYCSGNQYGFHKVWVGFISCQFVCFQSSYSTQNPIIVLIYIFHLSQLLQDPSIFVSNDKSCYFMSD